MRRNVAVVAVLMFFFGIGVGYFIAFAQFLNEVRGTFDSTCLKAPFTIPLTWFYYESSLAAS